MLLTVGTQTLKRAQDMVIGLTAKEYLLSGSACPVADVKEDETRAEGVLRDDIYSARSPSPQSVNDGFQFSRRSDVSDANPKVIPTDRYEFSMAGSFRAVTTGSDSLYAHPLPNSFSRLENSGFKQGSIPYERIIPKSRLAPSSPDERVHNSLRDFPPNRLDSFATMETKTIPLDRSDSCSSTSHILHGMEKNGMNNRWNYHTRVHTEGEGNPGSDNTVYEYGHGQSKSMNQPDESLFERRKPEINSVTSEGRTMVKNSSWNDNLAKNESKSAAAIKEDQDMRRRIKEWEESSDEDEILIIRQGKKVQDHDMRLFAFELRPSRSTAHRSEGIQSPEPDDISESNTYGFGKDISNPISSSSLHSGSTAPVAISKPPICSQNLTQPPTQTVPLHMMNINPPLFNPFLNSAIASLPGMAASQMFLQTQAQLMMGFPRVPNSGAGLLPLSTQNIQGNSLLPPFKFSTANPPGFQVPAKNVMPSHHHEPSGQTQEEIMMSRIRARAAESFNLRVKGTRPQDLSGNSDIHGQGNLTTDVSLDTDTTQQTANSLMTPHDRILDPRLKPRQPRDSRHRESRRPDCDDDNRYRKHEVRHQSVNRRSGDHRIGNHSHSDYRSEGRERLNSGDKNRRMFGDREMEYRVDNYNTYGRVKRTFVNASFDRNRRFSGDCFEDDNRPTYGDQYIYDRCRRLSDEQALAARMPHPVEYETDDRVSRNFCKHGSHRESHLSNTSDWHIRTQEIEAPTTTLCFSERVKTSRVKLNQTGTEETNLDDQYRVEEPIKEETGDVHPIATNSRIKTDLKPAEAVIPTKVTENAFSPEKRASTFMEETKRKRRKVSEKLLEGLTGNEEDTTRLLRRSPRTRPPPVSTANLKQSSKVKITPRLSPTIGQLTMKKITSDIQVSKIKILPPPVEEEPVLTDSEDELKIDIPEPLLIIEQNLIPNQYNNCGKEQDCRTLSPTKISQPDRNSAATPEKSPLPAGADELIKSLLFRSLNKEEAEILKSSEDYLSSTLARLKEELSAKVKEKNQQTNNCDYTETSSNDTSRVPLLKLDTKVIQTEVHKTDELSRSRTLSRRKPQTKRRSSLEKLHDALREMKFDSMMPLGPRRTQSRSITR